MNHEVECFEGELRELRRDVEILRGENHQLRAQLGRCTCGAAAGHAPTTPNEEQLDLLQRIGCAECDE